MIGRGQRAGGGNAGDRRGAGPEGDREYAKATRDRRSIFFYDIFVCILLAVLAWAYFAEWTQVKSLIPPNLQGTPIYAVWFGALGGIVISLKGVYDHGPRDWQYQFNL